jgi:HK97 family phage major capsid protein
MPGMLSAKALREKRAPLAKEIRRQADALHAANEALAAKSEPARDFSAEEKGAWEKVNSDYNALTRQIEIAEQVEKAEGEQTASIGDPAIGREIVTPPNTDGASAAVTEEHRAAAFQAWAATQMGHGLTVEQEEACRAMRFNPGRAFIDIPLYRSQDIRRLQQRFRAGHPEQGLDRLGDFRAVLSGQVGEEGGYTIVPETLIRQLEINMLAYGGVEQVAEVMTTSTGERMSWPTADDTSNTGQLLGESANIGITNSGGVNSGGTVPSFAKVYWDSYKFSSKPVLVPFELFQDSAFNLASVLGDMLGERLGRISNTYFTTGTGANQPKGIVACAAVGNTTASGTAITADEIINLEHQIDPAYRNGAGYMMHDGILLALRKLKDGMGQYLWQSGFNGGTPDRLNARPVTINQDMQSTVATGTKTILFGQLSRYKIRRVGSVRFYRLEERYRDNDQDGFIAFLRQDGNLLTAGTAPVKYLLQA